MQECDSDQDQEEDRQEVHNQGKDTKGDDKDSDTIPFENDEPIFWRKKKYRS